MKVAAVVVTYNRKELLEECIESLQNQTYELNNIIIIDNNSTDGTDEMIKEKGWANDNKFIIKRMEKNTGGAGGFYEGMKMAREMEADWIWIMDDDTIPDKNALEELINSLSIVGENISYLASNAYDYYNNGDKFTCNYPIISKRRDANNYITWKEFLEYGIVEVEKATFVSILINGQATKKIGLPFKDFFIWGDDQEYTLRLTKHYAPAYLIGKSSVRHKIKGKNTYGILKEDNINRINLEYYRVRNNLINKRESYNFGIMLAFILKFELNAFKCLFCPKVKYRWKKFFVINKGIFAYIFRRYNYKEYKNRFNS